ncbi:MAG: F0F1 ATP synthase subunit delta [Ottowia sp.]|uniref:F0F1 ATP synthase subunit delta n=1 Tax=unclassified Ottowia TaxID=2645081 RepID=UPI003C2E8B3F
MAELATIARPYAEALFQASRADLAATQSWLDGLAGAAASDELLQFAADPRADARQVFDVVTSVLKNSLPEKGTNFLRTVIENGRLVALPEVARQFRVLANEVSGNSDALIQSAFPIDAAELNGLVATLEKRFGRKLQATVQIEPALIGGVRVTVGDEVLDTSVKARLEQMKTALTA